MRKPDLRIRLLLPLVALFVFVHIAIADPPTQWSSRGPGGGGALFAPSFSPHNPNELYIACDMSELFRSTNLGAAWEMVNFRQIQGNRQTVVRYTSDPMIMYALDYSVLGGLDLVTPSKSTNGGATWTRMTSDPTAGEAYALFADGGSANRLVVSDYSRLYFSSDGGATFAQKFSTASGNGCLIAGAFFDGANIYVGTNLGLLVSTNGGASFALSTVTGIPSTQAIASFAGAKQGGVTRFFCVTLDVGEVYPGFAYEGAYFGYAGIYSLDWGQASWSAKTSGIAAGDMPIFVSMARNDISTAYVAGQNGAEFPIIYKTTTAGGNWQSVLLTNNNQNIFTGWAGRGGDRDWSYGAGALGFAVSPTDANKVAFTDLGFAHLTTDGGATWRQMYVNPLDQNPSGALTPKNRSYRGIGLEDTSCWWLTWVDANNIFASYSDIRGTRSTDGGVSWSFNYTGQAYNSTYQSVKHTNGTLYVGTSSAHDIYQSTYLTDARLDGATGEVKYSTNGGASWLTLHDFSDPVIGLALDPNNPTRLYASVIHSTAGGIYVSNNIQNGASSTWTKLANPPRTEGHPFNIHVLNDGTLVCSYSGRRNAAGTFTASSGVFASTNGGASWEDRSHTGMRYWTKDIVIDPHDANQNTWYACVFSGWGGPPNGLGGLYKTTNRGVNWTRINSLDRVGSCAISPINPNEMYLTTEVEGLWYSNNINSPTPSFAAVMSYPFRQPERVFFNPFNQNEVWVTSFGHGIRVGTGGGGGCSYSLAPTSAQFGASGGTGSFSVTAGSGCAWDVTSSAAWLTVTFGASGTGNGTVNYAVAANPGAARAATLTVAGQTFTVNQSGGGDGTDTVGLYAPSGAAFFLRNTNSGGVADITFTYGPAGLGWVSLVGDWNGDGIDTVGLYSPSQGAFFLRNTNSGGVADISFSYGPAGLGWIPIVGDWDGNGTDTIGLYSPSQGAFFLRNTNSGGVADVSFSYGPGGLGWVPLVGDWNGDRVDTVGLYAPSSAGFYLRNTNSGGIADLTFTYGPAGAGLIPLVGDWDGDGVDTIGLYSSSGAGFFLRNTNSGGVAHITFAYGPAGLGWRPLIGDWDGS